MKVEIKITDDTGSVKLYDVSDLVHPITPMSIENSYRYNTLCARSTLYPGKTIEEVNTIIEDSISKWNSNN